MKSVMFKTAAIFLFLLYNIGCSDSEKPTFPDEQLQGKVNISLSKTTIPQGVYSVTAILTRQNYTTITSSLNLTGQNTAEIELTNIVPGKWHLIVNAADDNRTVIYSGETDIDVQSSALTQVSLTLSPVGKVNISVNWEYNKKLLDYPGNPILTKYNNGTPYGPYYGRVLYDDGKFKMWFANSYGSDKYDIGYAESYDGFTWNIVNGSVIQPGPPGSWDSYGVHPGAVIKDGNVYKMYYCGQSVLNDNSNKRIGLAFSYDGISWYKNSESFVNQINLTGYTTDIMKINGTYYLYYGSADVIGVATSSDGLNWNKSTKSIITATEPWEGNRIWSCTVINDGSRYKMLYTNDPKNAFGYAESVDGINWIKKTTPIFTYNETNNLWPFDIRYPFLRKVGETYYIFYSTVSSNFECKLGVAIASELN